MYQIGSCDTDILCVTEGTNQFHEGEVLYIKEGFDIYNPDDNQILLIAKDFEQFLIIAGNLNQIHREIDGDFTNSDEKFAEFFNRLDILGIDKIYQGAWESVF